MSLRICHTDNFRGIIEYDTEKGKFTGPKSKHIHEIIDLLVQILPINGSIVVQPNNGIGNIVDNKTIQYDGCIGKLQRNESDMILMLMDYPIDAPDLKEGYIFVESKLTIGSVYLVNNKKEASQILSSFDSFSLDVWALCFIFILLIWLMMLVKKKIIGSFYSSIGRKRKNKNTYDLYHITKHSLRLGQVCDNGKFKKIIFITCSVFSLLVVHYFSSFIKTQLIVIKDPDLFESYNDIIKGHAKPYFIKGLKAETYFSQSDTKSARGKLWKYAVERFGENNFYIEIGPIGLLLRALQVLLQRGVVIMDSVMSPIVAYTGCQIKGKNPNSLITALDTLYSLLESPINSWHFAENIEQVREIAKKEKVSIKKIPEFNYHISVDPSEEPILKGFVFSGHLQGENGKFFLKAARHALEHGISNVHLKSVWNYDLLATAKSLQRVLGPTVKDRMPGVRDCLKVNSIVQEYVEYTPVIFENVITTFYLYFLLIAIALIILKIEIYMRNVHEKERRFRPTKKLKAHSI